MVPYRVDKPDPNAADDSGTDGHVAVLRACLQRATEECEHATEDHSLLAAELVSEPATEETAKHSSEIVNSDEAALFRCVRYDAIGTETHCLDVPG